MKKSFCPLAIIVFNHFFFFLFLLGWSDVISCYRNASGVIATVLAGNKSKGKINDCPSSPVRFDFFQIRSLFNFTIQLLSHGLDYFPLDNHVIEIFENNTSIQNISLQETTKNKTSNVSFAISRTFNKVRTFFFPTNLSSIISLFTLFTFSLLYYRIISKHDCRKCGASQ